MELGKRVLGRLLRFNFFSLESSPAVSTGESSSLALSSLSVCLKACSLVVGSGPIAGEVHKNGILFYAVVSAVMATAFGGMALFKGVEGGATAAAAATAVATTTTGNKGDFYPYGRRNLAIKTKELLEELRSYLSRMKSLVTSAFTDPHMRRTKELCDVLAINFRNNVDELDKMINRGGGQTDIGNFLEKKKTEAHESGMSGE